MNFNPLKSDNRCSQNNFQNVTKLEREDEGGDESSGRNVRFPENEDNRIAENRLNGKCVDGRQCETTPESKLTAATTTTATTPERSTRSRTFELSNAAATTTTSTSTLTCTPTTKEKGDEGRDKDRVEEKGEESHFDEMKHSRNDEKVKRECSTFILDARAGVERHQRGRVRGLGVEQIGGEGVWEDNSPLLETVRAPAANPKRETDWCTASVHGTSGGPTTTAAAAGSSAAGCSVVQEQREGAQLEQVESLFTENKTGNNDKEFSTKFCRCETAWPPVSSLDEVDVDAPILLSVNSGREICVECGLQVVLPPIHEVLLSVLQDRHKFLNPPSDAPPSPPPTSTPPPATPTSSEAGAVLFNDRWTLDLFLSREDPVSVDSPTSSCCCDSESQSSDLSTVICVDECDVECDDADNDVACSESDFAALTTESEDFSSSKGRQERRHC